MEREVREKINPKVFYAEVGCYRLMPHVYNELELDDDYDHDNPDGSMYGRRNYRETVYLSGTADQSPGEYLRAPSKAH